MEAKQPHRTRKIPGPKTLYKHPGGLVITAVVVALGALAAVTYLIPKGERINSRGYQIVYLDSGQAYFGKLKNVDGNYVVLENAYTTSGQGTGQDNVQSQTAIIKVSEQVYGPEDSLSIKSDQVVFWQNLRDDSKVVQAIKNSN